MHVLKFLSPKIIGYYFYEKKHRFEFFFLENLALNLEFAYNYASICS